METAFESLVYESDYSVESNESVRSTKSHAGRRGRRRNSLCSVQSQPVRRSLRKSTVPKVTPKSDGECGNDENLNKSMPVLNEKNSADSTVLGYDRDYEDIKILGATELNGKLQFIYKWNDQDVPHLIPNEEAKIKFPYALMNFYESCMVWDVSEEEVEDAKGTEDK